MWLMTPRGFYSAVQKRGDDTLTIRGRNRADLEAILDLLGPDAEIVGDQGSDYTWRIKDVSRAAWARACASMALEIDYANFKDEVKRKQGAKRAGVYGQLWSTLLRLEDRAPRSRFGAWHSFDDELDALPRARTGTPKRRPAPGKRGSKR